MGKHPFKILCIDGGGIKVFFHHIIIIAVTIFAVVTAIFLKISRVGSQPLPAAAKPV